MNRSNLKIVIAAFLIAAAIAWFIGHVLYSRPGQDEINCTIQCINLWNFYETNNAPTRELLLKVSQATLDNASSLPDERRAALRAELAANNDLTSELDAEKVWTDKRHALALQRQQAQFPYTLTAGILIALAAALGLLLFITSPPKPA